MNEKINRRNFSIGMAALGASGIAQSSTATAKTPTLPIRPNRQTTDVKPVDELVDRKTKQAIDKGLEFLKRKQLRAGKNKGAFGNTGYPSGVAGLHWQESLLCAVVPLHLVDPIRKILPSATTLC